MNRTQQKLQQLLEASFVCPMSAFYLQTADGHVYCLGDESIEQTIRRGDYRWAEPAV